MKELYYDQKNSTFCVKVGETKDPDIVEVFRLDSRSEVRLCSNGLCHLWENLNTKKNKRKIYVIRVGNLKRSYYKHKYDVESSDDKFAAKISNLLQDARNRGDTAGIKKYCKFLVALGNREVRVKL